MMESPNEFLCPKCGSKTESIFEGRSSGTKCTKCDWSVFTTFAPPIKQDFSEYEIFVTPTTKFTETQIKMIAKLLGINFLQARKKSTDNLFQVYKGRAEEIVSVRDRLDAVGLHYQIRPEFNW